MVFFQYRPTLPLFNYTATAGFYGVIKSKKLWLSDVTASNDPRELLLGQSMLADAVKRYKDDDVLGVSTRNMAEFLAELLSFQRQSTCYACCFALDGDELPMWREYADGGKGVSIGFRPTAMASVPGRMQLVRYAEDDADDYFASVVIQAAITMGKSGSVDRILAMASALAAVTSLKHRTWKYEREVRVIYNQRHAKPDPGEYLTQFTGEHSDGSIYKWTEPLVRQSRKREVLYHEFDYGRRVREGADPKRAIEVVYRGPKCEMSAAEINAVLVAEGFEGFQVLQSECEIQ